MLEKFKNQKIEKRQGKTIQGGSSSGQPGGSLNLRIRGINSLASNTPLYIVD